MKVSECLAILSLITTVSFNQLEAADQASSQMMGQGQNQGMGMGRGMGMGMGNGMGMMGVLADIPDTLPKPKNAEWIKRLSDALVLERESYAQYKSDSSKYHLRMPYRMIIHQESMHIQIIEDLFEAYGLTEETKTAKIVVTKDLEEALANSIKMEQNLIDNYVWLVKNAEDETSAYAINRILIQSRWHLAIFQQLEAMGGNGMGHGMMMMMD